MNQDQTRQKLNDELKTFIGLKSEAERELFWQKIEKEAAQRPESEKAAIHQAIADDIEQIRQRVLSLRQRVEAERGHISS